MTREEESAVIRRVLSGDADAFESLVTENQTRAYHLAWRLLGNEADAADAVQDAFLKAYTSLKDFRGESRFSVWLYRLVNNVCIDMLRKRRRTDAVPLQTTDDEGDKTELPLPDAGADPQELLERAEDVAAVRRAMDSLPEDCRQILTLRELAGLSYDEIARALSLETGTVKSRLNRARKKLCRQLLEDGNFSGSAPSNKRKEV